MPLPASSPLSSRLQTGLVNAPSSGVTDAGTELLAPRADDPLHAGEPERDEQQPRLVHVISVLVHHDDLGVLLVKRAAQPVGGQRPAGAAAQDHDSLPMIILRSGAGRQEGRLSRAQ